MEPVEATGQTAPAPVEAKPAATKAAPRQKTMVGRVASNKMTKTVVVEVEKLRRHPIYHRSIRRLARYKVHDEQNSCNVGDLVRIAGTRPLSKEKRWRVVEILERGAQLGSI